MERTRPRFPVERDRCIRAAGSLLRAGPLPRALQSALDAEAEVDVPAGERATLTLPDLPAGIYQVTCTYHPQMEGALRVPPPA